MFPECSNLPAPVMMVQGVSFRYNENTPWIYKNLEFGMDLDTRVALVGPNGAGKSTLLKVLNFEMSIFFQLTSTLSERISDSTAIVKKSSTIFENSFLKNGM